MSGFHASVHLADDAATTALGVRLAPLLAAGDTILLEGPIGAGKTHLCRALIQARLAANGVSEDVPSPTYTLVQTYTDGDTEIWHADLYRLGDPFEVVELGLDDAFATAIVLVEWPDRLGSLAPSGALTLELSAEGDGRRLNARSEDSRWSRIAPALDPDDG